MLYVDVFYVFLSVCMFCVIEFDDDEIIDC